MQDADYIKIFDTEDETNIALPCGNAQIVHFLYEWDSGVSAGSYSLRIARTQGYTGVWAEIDLQNFIDGGLAEFIRFAPLGFVQVFEVTPVADGHFRVWVKRRFKS